MNSWVTEIQQVLEDNILKFWLDNMQDEEYGGFYGRMSGDGVIDKTAEKGGILIARKQRSFYDAYRVFGNPEYLAAATRAKNYILEHFLDKEWGGTIWSVNYKGEPLNTRKQFYSLGFMLYGLTEYLRATQDKEVLRYIRHLYYRIEKYSWDEEFGGYIEARSREWELLEDMRLSELDANYPKSQNTHLHIIEPYTNYLRALKELKTETQDESDQIECDIYMVEESVERLINIFCDRILNPETHHLDLFFDMDWKRGAGWLESYGHDIECSWLMHEAALVLGDEAVLKKVEPIVKLVAEASEKGLNPDGSMTHEANLDTGHVDDDRHWWVQAEAVVGFFNLYQHFGDEGAKTKALNCWQYIKDNLIDYEHGEWYWSRDKHGVLNTRDDHAGFWKCPYHNSRMCLEIIERTREMPEF